MEEDYENECEVLLPSMPTKPQKNLFSYFNVERRTTSSEDKKLHSKTKKAYVELDKNKKGNKDKEKGKSRNSCGISISLFGEKSAKKIGLSNKKLPKTNGLLEKYLTGNSDGENDEKDVDEDVDEDSNVRNEDVIKEDIKGKYDADESIIGNNRDINTTSVGDIIYDDKDVNSSHPLPENEENQKQNLEICGGELNMRDPCDNDITTLNKEEINETGDPDCLQKDSVSPVKSNESPTKKAKRKQKRRKQQIDSSDEELNKYAAYNNVIYCQNKRKNKKAVSLNCLQKVNLSPVKHNESPIKKAKRKQKRPRQQFDSSDEESNKCTPKVNKETADSDCRDEEMALPLESDCSDDEMALPLESEEHVLKVTEKDINVCTDDSSCQNIDVELTTEKDINVCTDDNPQLQQKEEQKMNDFLSLNNERYTSCENKDRQLTSLSHQKEEEKMDIINCFDNERVPTVVTNEIVHEKENNDNKSYVRLKDGSDDAKNIQMISNVYPFTSCSKYNSLLCLTDKTDARYEVAVHDNLNTRPLEDCLDILQSEYPDIVVKKIFLQLLNCQKVTITKNLTKVESSKKVLNTLWERDNKLKSEEIALAEEIKMKNEAELKKKKKNDIRLSFQRNKRRKKKDADMIIAEETNADNNIEKDPLVLCIVDDANVVIETHTSKKTPKSKKHKKKLKNKKGIVNYLQKQICADDITTDTIKPTPVGGISESLSDVNKEVNKTNEIAIKEFTECKVKGEGENSNSLVLESEYQCKEISPDQNVTSRKRKLRRSNSGTKKKLKQSIEEPVTRRRSLRNQPQISIELNSKNTETSKTSDIDKEEKFTAVNDNINSENSSGVDVVEDSISLEKKNDNDIITSENSSDVVEDSISVEKKNVENVQNSSISTEREIEAPSLRRSTRVRKKVIDDIPNDFETDDEEDVSFKGIKKSEGDLKIEFDENSYVETEVIQETSDDDVKILKATLVNAIKTLDLLEHSPMKSPRKPTEKIIVDEEYMNSCLSWTEKYQPNKARYVIGEKSNTRQIFDWLTSWKERHESAIRKLAKSKQYKNDSDSDSESEESDFEDYLSNTMMLIGPPGCGTTATVYACANQLDFKVLELNPSIYRTGKQVLDKVAEAVVSHQVNKVINKNVVSKLPGDSITELKRMNFFQSKKESETKNDVLEPVKFSSDSTFSSTSVDAMSLILFEQADIVYEDIDRGFYQGIADLRLLSKRPIILTANNAQILETEFAEEDSWIDHISLTYPSTEKLLPILHLMCLVEQVFVPKQMLIDFIKLCRNDVRKIILQLMFWCDHGNKPLFKIWKAKNKKLANNSLDKDNKSIPEASMTNPMEIITDEIVPSHSETNILVTEILPCVLNKGESLLSKQQILNDGLCSCDNLHQNYSFMKCSVKEQYSAIEHIAATSDNISEMNSLWTIGDNYFERDCYKWTPTLRDSLSTTFVKEKENIFPYPMISMCKNVKEIYKVNYESFLDTNEKQIDRVNNRINISYSNMYKSVLHSHSAKYNINRRPFLEDVIPFMKKICQLEEQKFSSLHHRKRGNRRYMHYLQSSGIFLEDDVLEELTKPLL